MPRDSVLCGTVLGQYCYRARAGESEEGSTGRCSEEVSEVIECGSPE